MPDATKYTFQGREGDGTVTLITREGTVRVGEQIDLSDKEHDRLAAKGWRFRKSAAKSQKGGES
jgi:hypothetical protein